MEIFKLFPAVFLMVVAFVVYFLVGYSFIRKNKKRKENGSN